MLKRFNGLKFLIKYLVFLIKCCIFVMKLKKDILMGKTILTPSQELNIIKDYTENGMGIYPLCEKYKVGKIKIKAIFEKYNIEVKSKGKQPLDKSSFVVSDFKIKKYPIIDNCHYLMYDENTDFISTDIDNKGGVLTSYIEKQYNIPTPTLYDRRMYYMNTGNYWWEQWLKVKVVANTEVKKCPYCDWETIDVDNRSGMFETHLKKRHNMSKNEYIKEHPEDKDYFKAVSDMVNRQMEEDETKFVVCKVCGKKLARIDNHHLRIHHMTKLDYINLYGETKMLSDEYYQFEVNNIKKVNENMTFTRQSQAEKEIIDLLESYGVKTTIDRKILHGKEIDIFLPSYNIGIEYNGNLWHSEKYGKDKNYHFDKTNECEKNGVKLIQIFEDEYMLHKKIVFCKLLHALKIDNNLEHIAGRKCNIKSILKCDAEEFLEKNHIQGFVSSTVYLGAFYQNKLVGVMSFIEEQKNIWNLNRFATDNNYICQGIGGKLFKYFTTNFQYYEIKSFADRRWTSTIERNIYDILGFKKITYTKPDYRYYNPKVDRYLRFHKFNFRKDKLIKRYPDVDLKPGMTEYEMATKLGYTRIWDCGLIKYVYTNPKIK